MIQMTQDLLLKDYEPRSELVVPQHLVPKAKFPAVDAHNHLTYEGDWEDRLDMSKLLAEMDAANVATVVNLSGEWGDRLQRALDIFDRAHPGRFITYCNINFDGVGSPGWSEKTLKQLQADIRGGARGLKVYKELGLIYRDPQGKLVSPDDPRLSDLWDAAGAAGIPVTIHSADPVAFFRPLDRFNERWDELHEWPDWHFHGEQFPPFEKLIESLYHLIELHPKTNFITAHVGCYPENLGFVSSMMDRYPNFYTDIAARIAELGRAPYSSRQWFIKYADRILFGTDFTPYADMFQVHWRFLETADEYFNYSPHSPIGGQGRFCIYGIFLPDDVLEKVYRGNAQRLYSM
jgi:predicted TIM-barrel fold metal-dependent hydrolase